MLRKIGYNTLALTLLAVVTSFPSFTQVVRFAGTKDTDGKITSLDISDEQMPTRDGQVEIVSCVSLGEDEEGCALYAVMIQKGATNPEDLAVAAVEYLQQQGASQFATAAVALIGVEKSTLIGDNWTTMLVAETTVEGTKYHVRDIGQTTFVVDESDVFAYDAKNPSKLARLGISKLSAWMHAGDDSSVIDAAEKSDTYNINPDHLSSLTGTAGSFLRRSKGGLIVISDGRNNTVLVADGSEIQHRGFFVGDQEFALDAGGDIDSNEVLTFFTDACDISYKRTPFIDLPKDARDLLAA